MVYVVVVGWLCLLVARLLPGLRLAYEGECANASQEDDACRGFFILLLTTASCSFAFFLLTTTVFSTYMHKIIY